MEGDTEGVGFQTTPEEPTYMQISFHFFSFQPPTVVRRKENDSLLVDPAGRLNAERERKYITFLLRKYRTFLHQWFASKASPSLKTKVSLGSGGQGKETSKC
eukprot:TRINITY_DN6154_c0_g1_i2.p1 TRINITY_DN6154_c0_g1~~TRINITY_DN6154_c0_g1_i2.p1  ORF type:complete len:102 (+),score=20.13 TRINITY_DN6154_c0_g1_i2:431-736(+)